MTNLTIDARGCACPEPVIKTKKALAQGTENIIVLVDNQVAVENITRFVTGRGYKISVEKIGSEFQLLIKK